MSDAGKNNSETFYLPVVLGVAGGIFFVIIVLCIIMWYKRHSKAKRTLKWKELGLDSPPDKASSQRRLRLQRQKTIEFELPRPPKLVTTSPQVNYERYDSTGKPHLYILRNPKKTCRNFRNLFLFRRM